MDKLIYLILNKKNDIDNNYNVSMILNNKINYVFVDTKNVENSYYDKKDKIIYVKDKKDKLKYSLYWIYKQKKYEYVYVINDNNYIMNIFSDEISNYKFYTDKFKKDKKTLYPINNYIMNKKCLKILLSSIDKIKITNKDISKLFIKYRIFLNKNNTEKIEKNKEIELKNIKEIELKNTKILYLVLCCDNKSIYINNQMRIIEMLENAKVNYLLLKANTETIVYKEENKTLFVDVVDVYENLPMKIYKGYEWVYHNTDYEHVYKIDDNFVFTDKNKIPTKLYDYYGNFLIKNLDRKWHFGKCSNNELNNLQYQGKLIAPFAAGGFGYILSRKCLEILIKNKEIFYNKNEYYEDKIVGDILYKNNIFANNIEYKSINNNIEYKSVNNKKNTSLIIYDLKKDTFNEKLNNDILILNSLNLLINKFEKKINNSNIIISLSVIPPRFLNKEFILVIDSLYNQIIKPEKIVINICHEYRRNFEYDKNKFEKYKKNLLKKYDNLIINYTFDYGPITKFLGLYNIVNNFSEESIIICLDDDWIMDKKLTYYYALVYQLYNCDCVFIDERDMIVWNKRHFSNMDIQKKENIFFDNYQNFVYGWLSFSFKLKHINELYNFYNKIITIEKNIINHDDLILTLFYKTMNLYACGINIIFNSLKRLGLDNLNALRTNAWTLRNDLEIKFLEIYNIKYIIRNNHVYIENSKENKSKLVINKKISKRNLLYNIENITVDPSKNNFHYRQIDIKYFNEKIFILTLTIFEDTIKEKENYNIRINNNNYEVVLTNKFSKKMSFFIFNKYKLNKINYNNPNNYNIIQTKENNNFSLYNFYATMTILNNLPEFEFKFFDNNDRIEFLNNYNPLITKIYKKLNIGAYKADLFRALYIYLNGGIYFDCKNILFRPIYDFINKEYCYCKDFNNGVCNGFLYCNKRDEEIYNYISAMIQNIFFNYYTDNFLGITGPSLFGKFIKRNIDLLNNIPINNNWKLSYMTDNNNNIVIKNSYNGYYEENNYLEKEHYSVKWNNKNVYLETQIDYNKINFVKHIVWINLDRSIERKEYMEKLLSNINIPNTRISAVDGREEPVREYINHHETTITNYEIACSLSHIKCISYLYELENTLYNNGENNYYIVCEDDISLDTLNLFNFDLSKVINDYPDFDILMVSKIFHKELASNYTDWNIEFNKRGDNHIAGTACYIISSEGIRKSINNFFYKENQFIINKSVEVADVMMYRYLRTYVYKYNYIGTLDDNSTIHNDHVNWHRKCSEIQNMIIIKNNIII